MIPDDIEQMSLRLRGPEGCLLQGGLTLNPISDQHWIKLKYFDQDVPGVLTHRSTYRDNDHLNPLIKERMMAITDPYYKKVYVDGEWGIFSNGVFHDYVIEDFDYGEDDLENVSNGIDFGFAHASALIRVGFREDEIYVFDEVYGKGWVNSDFIKEIEDSFGFRCHDWPITAESAEPDRIEEFRRMGFHNIMEAQKGVGSLKYGIDYLSSKKIHVHRSKCPNMAREIVTYKRRTDNQGNAIDAFVEMNDDCIAACLSGDTLVNTVDGDVKIRDLVGKKGLVGSFDGVSYCERPFDCVSLTRHSQKVYTLAMEDGGKIDVTLDHPILTKRGWVKVMDLLADDEVIKIENNMP
jgi:phage terminase large subunit